MRRLRLISFASAFALITLVLAPFQWLFISIRHGWARSLPLFYHRMICRLMGVSIKSQGTIRHDQPMLILSNHVSWIDIVVLSAVMPLSFIAKSEVAGWPVFGLLARLQRTVFVDRERRAKTRQTNQELGQRLTEGDAIVLFAEGTTSDGLRILPFRSPLVGAAREALLGQHPDHEIMIQPVCLLYTHRNGLRLSRTDMPHIGWYGDMDLLPHLSTVITAGPLDVLVAFGKPIAFSANSDRKLITRQAEAEVRRLFDASRGYAQ
ncbi:MAG: lysophospholipid acyltransferase family protein [Hyphomicrobiales bacterium]|jgi:1-acyl-sn-glycerol-3-phosphate acyltransferase|nr:lysophospholipid acyltransferase family protein [Hyphomicrobiales bacterium]